MSLKILLVSDHYPPFIGGAHRQTQLLAQELRQRGYEVAVATVWHGGFPDEQLEDGVRVHRVRQMRTAFPLLVSDRRQRYQSPYPDPISTLALRRLLDRFRPDVVHTYGWISYSVAAAMLGKDIPLLVSGRDYGYSCAKRTLQYGNGTCSGPQFGKCLKCSVDHYGALKGILAVAGVALSRPLLLRKLTGFHSISHYVQYVTNRDVLEFSRQQPPVVMHEVIPSFRADDETEEEQDAAYWMHRSKFPAEPFILFVGALRAVKGVRELLAAYARLSAPPALVLIGTTEWDSPQRFPPGVTVVEDLPHAAVMGAWRRCLFGVVPSLWPEPLGSVVHEGMSCGKPVIGTYPGGHVDMIEDGVSGLLVPQGDIEALTNAMGRLITDPGLRDRLGGVGLEKARQFHASASLPRFEALYHGLVALRGGVHRE